MKLPATLSAFRQGRFARYMAGETISMVGTWMQTFAQGWVLTSLTHSASILATINLASGLPMLFLTLIGGNAADRYDKRRILYSVLLIQIVSATTLGWLVGSNRIQIWHILAAATCLGIAAAFEVPTVSAFVPELVDRDQISSAISIDRSVFHFTRLLGPAAGGWLIAQFGTASAYYLNALSFVALIAALLSIPAGPPRSAGEEEKRRTGIKEGLNYVRKDAPTLRMILLMTASAGFVSPFLIILMPLYSRVTLGLPAEKMGILMAVSGIGSLSGSLGLLSIGRGHRATALKFGSAVVMIGILGLALAPSLAIACVSIVCLTLGLSTNFGLTNIVIQERTPHHLRGRVSSIASLSFFGLVPFAGLLISALVDLLGMRNTMLGCAAGYALFVTALLSGVRQLASAPLPDPEPDAEAVSPG